MGRLIDADVLMEYFKRLSDECSSENDYEYSNLYDCVCAKIMTQPTAYYVEKVDNQILEYFKGVLDKKPDGWDVVDFSCDVRRIVRKGGVDGC